MNYAAIFHRPMSEYAYATGEDSYVFTLRCQRCDIKRCIFHYADRADMAPKLSFTEAEMQLLRRDRLYDWFRLELKTPLSRIAYYFELSDGTETVYYLGDCFERDAEQGRSDYFQLPFNLRADRLTVPDWVSDAVVYNIFPDSFADKCREISCRGSETLYDGEVCRSSLGGTVDGIRENLDYIKELGCSCIYLNPVFAAGQYHKYDLLDYFSIDPLMGGPEDFRRLVKEAHELGIRVIIDGVFNHTSWRHPFFRSVLEDGSASPYYGCYYSLPESPRFPAKGEAPEYTCFAYVPEMPKTNTANPELREYFCRVGEYWIKEFDVDGWRLDVANEVDDSFLRAFRERVSKAKPDALVIGEVWENASHYINGNMLHSAMNYDFRRYCKDFFAEGRIDAEEFDLRVSTLLMRYPKQALPAQLNLLDSHDVPRFLSLCGGDRSKMELAVLFQMCFVGMPSIFYGDEKGLCGVEENEYRRPMEFEREDALEDVYKRLIALRHRLKPLRCGDFETLAACGGFYAFRRSFEGQRVNVYINNSPAPIKADIKGRLVLQKGLEGALLKARGYAVSII